MIKCLNRWEMSKKVNDPGCKIYVKHFAEANTTCMKDYMGQADHIPSNFLKAVFHKIYLVHS